MVERIATGRRLGTIHAHATNDVRWLRARLGQLMRIETNENVQFVYGDKCIKRDSMLLTSLKAYNAVEDPWAPSPYTTRRRLYEKSHASNVVVCDAWPGELHGDACFHGALKRRRLN